MASYLHFFLDAPGLLHDNTVVDFVGLYTLLTVVYECNGGKVVMDNSFARADYDFIKMSGQEVCFDLENVPWQNWQATST
jgi:hypothetical protein